jgi:hypothetical protein
MGEASHLATFRGDRLRRMLRRNAFADKCLWVGRPAIWPLFAQKVARWYSDVQDSHAVLKSRVFYSAATAQGDQAHERVIQAEPLKTR